MTGSRPLDGLARLDSAAAGCAKRMRVHLRIDAGNRDRNSAGARMQHALDRDRGALVQGLNPEAS